MGAVVSSETDNLDELHHEPEAAPCHPSSSPLSPQLTRGTSYVGPLIRVSDPYNILSPSSSSPRVQSSSRLQSRSNAASPQRSPSFTIPTFGGEKICTEILFIRHAESSMNLKPELIGGRSPSATLTSLGRRQARALGVHLRSVGMDFDAVYSSPLERAKQTAYAVCQELDILREAIEMSEAVQELSQGQWEGRNRNEIYTPALVPVMNSTQPDFRAPGGESQRQVEFRMVEFLNNVVLPRASLSLQKTRRQRGSREHLNEIQPTSTQVHLLEDMDVSQAKDSEESDVSSECHSEALEQIPDCVSSSNLSGCAEEQVQSGLSSVPYTVAVISHSLAIKCMLRGLTGCDPHFTTRWCIDNTSVTVVRHSIRKGWQLQRVNDTSHLRPLEASVLLV